MSDREDATGDGVGIEGVDESGGAGEGEGDHVVTAFLRNRGEILLLRRSDAVGTYVGSWGGVSGFAEGDPEDQVWAEIREETGLEESVSLVRSGHPVRVEDSDIGREWTVHPFLFDCDSRAVELSEEHDAFEWVPPTAILDADRETVPALWEAYERVAPTVRSITADAEHGAAHLSVRALEVLRDRAGVLVRERRESKGAKSASEATGEEWDELADLARRLLEARPSMAVLRNRVNRAMAEADGDAGAVLESTLAGIDRAITADEEAATAASEYATGTVATLSRSATVLDALAAGDPDRIYVAESRPAREGIGAAEELAAGAAVTVHTDAAVAHVLASESIDRVLVGADAVLPDGRVVNKTGTRAMAVAAAREDVPVHAVAASDKISARESVSLESGDAHAVYDGDAVDVLNPTFDVTPADCVTGVVTERGTLEPAEIREAAAAHRNRARWND